MLLNWGTGDTSPLSITVYLFKLMIILSNEIVWKSCDLYILKNHMENTSYISLRNILYKKHIILYERCTVPCENRVASYKKCTVLCKKSTISYTPYSVWEVCGKCTADKVVCFRVYTESQALFLHKKVHIVSTQFQLSFQLPKNITQDALFSIHYFTY